MRVLPELQQDIRYGVRLLARKPAFSIAAVMSLALAIGATTAVYSVVEGVLLRPLPYRDPDRLVRLWEVTPRGVDRNVVSAGNYLDWRDRAQAFDVIGAHTQPFGIALTDAGEPLTVTMASLTPSLLTALGVQPQIGRLFSEEEGEDGGPRVVLLSDTLWRQRFDGDPSIIGRGVVLNGQSFTVVGIMRPDFRFPDTGIEVWRVLQFGERQREERRSHNYGVVARLSTGVGLGGAEAEMQALASQIAAEQPTHMTGWSVNVVRLHDDLVGDARPLITLLFGVVVVVLLVACANLANLMLARATEREQEMSVRSALGAGRGRIVRQLLTESLMLAGAAGLFGVGILTLTFETLVAAVPKDIPLVSDVHLNVAVLAFAAGITLLSALVVGLAPALRWGSADLRTTLQSVRTSAGSGQARFRSTLVVVQVALALVLLVGAALLVRSFVALNSVAYGFQPDGLLAVELDVPQTRYSDRAAQTRFYDRLLERVRGLPGVAAAATTSGAPGSGAQMTFSFAIQGKAATNPSGREDPVPLRAVTPGYFRTLGVPILSGREIEVTDTESAVPVVVLNAALARRYWNDADDPNGAIGQRISFVGAGGPWWEVVGIAGDTRDDGLDRPAPPMFYVPLAQKRQEWSWLTWQTLTVRAEPGVEPTDLLPSIRAALAEIDPTLPLRTVRTVNDLYAETMARRRFAMQLTAGFAALAMVLGAFGIYAVVAYSVAQRRREIGIRLALGASPRSVVRELVTGAITLVAAGAAIGVLSAAGLTRFLETLLFGVDAIDLPTFAAMVALFLAIAAVASWMPARRAMRVDPVEALRAE